MLEKIIFESLINNEEYARQAMPHLKEEYFHEYIDKKVFNIIDEYMGTYNTAPPKEAILLELSKSGDFSEDQFTKATELVESFKYPEHKIEWLIDETERFCQDKALYNGIMESIKIIDNKESNLSKGSIPQILSEALGVSFDTSIGHDFTENAEERYASYHAKEYRIPFDLEFFNKITKGGLPRKTFNVILAGCVHPDTKVDAFYSNEEETIKKTIRIGDIKGLLEEKYDVWVDSPDGMVSVNYFIDKGMWDEYILKVDGQEPIICNESHLFETTIGWVSAQELVGKGEIHFLTKDGFKKGHVIYTGAQVPIVDINVAHENHRYYTNGVSSHNTGVGKSLFMCHLAANNLTQGLNVLYITLEMAEEKIAERIDANLLDVTMDELHEMPKEAYLKKIERVKNKTKGKLIIKEYPTSSAGAANFRHLLNELKLKKNFIPDIIYIDYLNICSSSRLKSAASVNSYLYVKAIAEELRGLAVEQNIPIVSATQTNRDGLTASDLDLTNTSESIGLPATTDMMFALISSEELEALGQIMVKQLKNRYNDLNYYKRFVIGVDRSKMKLYDAEQSAQENIVDDTPLMDKTPTGQRLTGESKFDKSKFDDFK